MAIAQQACNLEIDYTNVETSGNQKRLPFTFELNLASSNLTPAPGENQRFCYDVTGVGTDTSTFADLSHFVMGICDTITANMITNISVVINGVEQTVTFPGNVELFIPPNTDPPTGCSGLKFDFGLNKVSGTMTVCFELTTTFPVGPVPVCVFGGNSTGTGLSICGPVCNGEVGTCEAVGFQPATICVPVTVTPFAIAGTATTFCCGDTIITPGTHVCPGTVNGSCTFTMTQNICVAVPVEFGAHTAVGSPSVQCGDATDVDICTDCNNGGTAAATLGTKNCTNCK